MSGILHEVVWEDLEQFVKRVAKIAIASGLKAEALSLLKNLRDDREHQPLVTFINLRAQSLLEKIDKMKNGDTDEPTKTSVFRESV
jgi:hypothetical protein